MARKSTQNTTPEAPAAETEPQIRVTLVGRLCADPVLRHTASSGNAVTTIRLAVNDGPEATFHSVVAWGRTAEVVCQYLRKGRLVQAEGRTQERSYETGDGEQRTVTELVAWRVQFLGREKAAPEAATEQAVA